LTLAIPDIDSSIQASLSTHARFAIPAPAGPWPACQLPSRFPRQPVQHSTAAVARLAPSKKEHEATKPACQALNQRPGAALPGPLHTTPQRVGRSCPFGPAGVRRSHLASTIAATLPVLLLARAGLGGQVVQPEPLLSLSCCCCAHRCHGRPDHPRGKALQLHPGAGEEAGRQGGLHLAGSTKLWTVRTPSMTHQRQALMMFMRRNVPPQDYKFARPALGGTPGTPASSPASCRPLLGTSTACFRSHRLPRLLPLTEAA
jgi:hypothetical protein